MRRITRVLMGMAVAASAAVPALASPEGVWEFDTRDTRVEVSLCGDGTALCGRLVWLKDTSYNEQYEPYLDTLMVDRATQRGPNRWEGEMTFFGQKAGGTITQTGADRMTIKGCIMLVLCKTYKLRRYED